MEFYGYNKDMQNSPSVPAFRPAGIIDRNSQGGDSPGVGSEWSHSPYDIVRYEK